MSTWTLRTHLDLDAVNLHLVALEAAGLLGIAEEGSPGEPGVQTTLYFARRVDALPFAGTWQEVPDQDWHEQWKASVQPVTVGPLTIVPSWHPDARAPATPGGATLVIDMGQAFGTGHHETTTGCLAALLELDLPRVSGARVPGLTGRRVLDVGTGTGVLAIAAAKLGATEVVGCDVDPLATEAAAVNAELNRVALQLHTGSLDAVPEGRFDVVLANLDTTTLSRLATQIVARLAPGGALVASGVSIERRQEAIDAFAAAGLHVHDRAGKEWVVLTAYASVGVRNV